MRTTAATSSSSEAAWTSAAPDSVSAARMTRRTARRGCRITAPGGDESRTKRYYARAANRTTERYSENVSPHEGQVFVNHGVRASPTADMSRLGAIRGQ